MPACRHIEIGFELALFFRALKDDLLTYSPFNQEFTSICPTCKLALFFQIACWRNSGFILILPFALLLLPFLKIGFVWLCFLLPKTAQNHQNLRKSLLLLTLYRFAYFNIGFVFSNSTHSTRFGFNISTFGDTSFRDTILPFALLS